MNRLFGTAKPKAPRPTLDGASKSLDARGNDLGERVKKLDQELARYTEQMRKMKPGPAKQAVQQRAMRVLKQKKLYEAQHDKLAATQFNIDQVKFTQESMVDTAATVTAMQDANKELKKQFKSIDINKVEDLQDDMADLLEQSEEIQGALSRSYALDDVDDSALEDELAALEADPSLFQSYEDKGELGAEQSEVADYLTLPSSEQQAAAEVEPAPALPEAPTAQAQAQPALQAQAQPAAQT